MQTSNTIVAAAIFAHMDGRIGVLVTAINQVSRRVDAALIRPVTLVDHDTTVVGQRQAHRLDEGTLGLPRPDQKDLTVNRYTVGHRDPRKTASISFERGHGAEEEPHTQSRLS